MKDGDADSGASCTPTAPSDGSCWVTGGGTVDGGNQRDNFGGNAKPMHAGNIAGEWEHATHDAAHKLHGKPSYLSCRTIDAPGPGAPKGTANQAFFGGKARWFDAGTWAEGYWFDVVVEDRGEGKGAKSGGSDRYRLTVRKESDPAANRAGTIVYQVSGDIAGGNLQLHAPNGGHSATPSALPSWVVPMP